FIIPYIFVLSPELTLIRPEGVADLPWWSAMLGTGWVVLTAFTGMIAISVGIIGHWVRKVGWIERILALVAGCLLIYPENFSDIIGLAIFAGLLLLQYLIKNTSNVPTRQQA